MLVSNRDFPSEHFGRVYSASMYLPREHGKVRKYKADGYAGRRQNYFRRLESKTIYTYDWYEGKQLILFPENLETKLNVSLGTSL